MNDELRAPTPFAEPEKSNLSYWLYEATYFFSMPLMTMWYSLRTEGCENVPAQGPVLMIANHQSFLDPLLLGLSTRRHLCFLARKTLFRQPFFARLIHSLNAVPINQEGVGKEGITTILKLLRGGHGVAVFPEGERTGDGAIHDLRPGVHLLIKLTQAPVVPVGIAGAFDAWPRWRPFPIPAPLFLPAGKGTLAVSVGRPLDARSYAGMPREKVLQDLSAELKKVQERAEKLRRKP